jgi:hypothetical protein
LLRNMLQSDEVWKLNELPLLLIIALSLQSQSQGFPDQHLCELSSPF